MFFLLIFIRSVCFVVFGQVRQSITTLTRIFPIGSSARCISSSRGTDCRLQKSHEIAMHHASLLRRVKSRQHLQITASCRKELLNRKLCTACGKRIRFGKKLPECKVCHIICCHAKCKTRIIPILCIRKK